MSQPSIRRHLLVWVLGALGVGALVLVFAAYKLTLDEMNEVLDDSVRQTALLLADRDLAGALPDAPLAALAAASDTESQLVAIARRPDGSLLFTSEPAMALRFDAVAGHSLQRAQDGKGSQWHVFTVVQDDRIVQVAQPTSVRREVAVELASQLFVPLLLLVAMIGALLVLALRRGMRPLRVTTEALAARHAASLAPLELQRVPLELLPLVSTLNDLFARLAASFETQRHFVADAAHELRSPITALQLQLQVLERSRDEDERRVATAELSAGMARARRLMEQLLDLSQASAQAAGHGDASLWAPLHLSALARTVVARRSPEAERKDIDLGADETTDSVVRGDRAQLEMLLDNLVSNALRYTPRGGVVDVIVDVIDGAPTLRVIDNGAGIAPEERTRVFDRFYRSPEAIAASEAGSGLGLAIVKTIADRHGASVSLLSGRNGVGLEARVSFAPASTAATG